MDALRAWADAVLTGAGTLRSDNPRLRVRSIRRRAERRSRGRSASPARVVLTASGDIDPHAAFFAEDGTDRLWPPATSSASTSATVPPPRR
ncbi:dihydrofolate reductase family protein [Streptomyces himalayensis]|uniref:dihydrofolate reductase family protein n=1 Tax=Streptomyces himalayensis TaxID=2820085 RepID=UPI0035A81F56